jgi:hypothetical protein
VTKQDKTRQAKPSQAKPSQDTIRHDKIRQDNTRQDKPTPDNTRQGKNEGKRDLFHDVTIIFVKLSLFNIKLYMHNNKKITRRSETRIFSSWLVLWARIYSLSRIRRSLPSSPSSCIPGALLSRQTSTMTRTRPKTTVLLYLLGSRVGKCKLKCATFERFSFLCKTIPRQEKEKKEIR